MAAAERPSLQGWVPAIESPESLAGAIEQAFDYRGDVTIVRRDGSEIVGYLYNRDAEVAQPFVQVFPQQGGGELTVPYAEIRTVRFTGRDTAAGNSYAAWLRSREAARAVRSAPDV